MLLFDLRSLYNPEELSRVEHSCCIRKPADKSRFATCCSRLNPLNTIQDGWKYRSTANQPDGRWRSGIGRLGRTSQITFQLQQSETRLKFLSKPHVEAKEGHLCDSRCHLSLSLCSTPLCYVLMDSVGNPCGTDYIVEGSGFDRLQISTVARQQRLHK